MSSRTGSSGIFRGKPYILVGGGEGWEKPAVALQIKCDALEEVVRVIDSIAAPLEDFEFVVEPLDC